MFFKLALTWCAVSPIMHCDVRRSCCDAPKDVSMDSRVLSIPARIIRGLLAAVSVFASLLPGVPCCGASPSCCDSCSCSQAEVNRGAFFPETCCCAERPVTNGIVSNDHRDAQKQDRNTWLAESSPSADQPASLTLDTIRLEPRICCNPSAHNLRQAILCVWRK